MSVSAPWSPSSRASPATSSQFSVCSWPRRPSRPGSWTASLVSSQSPVRVCSMPASTTVARLPESTMVTARSSSSPSTSVSPRRCSNRLRLIVPEASVTELGSMPVTRPIGTKIRRRATTPTTRASTRGGAVPTRSAATTSRTLPTRSPLGSNTVSPTRRETYALVAVVTVAKATVGPVTGPELQYEVLDVFAPRASAGNPLAVVFDADELSTEQCQALAFEFHLSETSFLCAPTEPGADYKVRIFTPYAELPFAGPPSVGAAHTLVRAGRLPAGTVHQECGAGVLPIVVTDGGATLTGGRPTLEDGPDPAVLAEAMGLSAVDAVGLPAHVAGCGLPWTFLAVRPEVVDEARPDPAALGELGLGEGVVVCAWTAETGTSYARAFANDLGWGEDPATGSAALGAGVWLVANELLSPNGTSSYTVRQGEWMGRPSLLECTVTARGGRTEAATVQGAVVPVAAGRIRIP